MLLLRGGCGRSLEESPVTAAHVMSDTATNSYTTLLDSTHALDELAPATVTADMEAFTQAAMWAATFLRAAIERFKELSAGI